MGQRSQRAPPTHPHMHVHTPWRHEHPRTHVASAGVPRRCGQRAGRTPLPSLARSGAAGAA